MEDLYLALLYVLDKPLEARVIASTDIPILGTNDTIYYMIDRVEYDENELEDWHVSDNLGNSNVFTSHRQLIEYFDGVKGVIRAIDFHIESL